MVLVKVVFNSTTDNLILVVLAETNYYFPSNFLSAIFIDPSFLAYYPEPLLVLIRFFFCQSHGLETQVGK